MRKLLRRRGRTREEAEDLIQEAFLRMQAYCKQGGEVREPEAFLVRTVLRLSMNAHRHEHRHLYAEETVEDLSVADLGPSPDEVLAAEQCLKGMREALDSVNRRTREVFFMHRLDGLSYEQIAHQLSISVSAVEKHIARAVAVLTEQRQRK